MKNTLLIVLLIALGASVFTYHHKADQIKYVHTRDTTTVVKIDTLIKEVVKYITKEVVRVDTVNHYIVDSIGDTTTVLVPLPISQHLFTDYETYKCLVSGYGVSLDMMETYQKTVFRDVLITKTPRPKRWGLGVQVGYGINTSGDVKPYIGVGVSYNLLRF